MKSKNYEKYKYSGIQWIGEIPEHWETHKIKDYLTFKIGGTPSTSVEEFFEGNNIWVSISDLTTNNSEIINDSSIKISDEAIKYSNVKKITKGSLLYSFKLSLGATAFAGCDLYTNEAIASFEPNKFIDLNFLKYVFKVGFENNASENIYGAKLFNTNLLKLSKFVMPTNLNEQKTIANNLDKETSKINKIILKNREIINLLKEKKDVLIKQCITKGLNHVKMKDSGIDIVGLIPKNNKIVRLKFLCDINTGNKDTVDRDRNGKYPFYVRSPKIERINSYSYDGEAILMAGDGVGAGKIFHYANGKFDYHQRVYNIHNLRNIYPKFLYYYMSSLFSIEIEKGSAKSTVDSIRLPMLENFLICFPQIDEQKKIAQYLDVETEKISLLILKIQKQNKLLKEYKNSLIYHVVTGKIDLTEVNK